ncbi:hypothetical protein DERF_006752 [Dermatophagoides farinae]|uniref:Uncharacterized protein n=1 Tax=Dermatophagoides farinae TaxID=6954 RepID=A0A922HZQ4_DERFA|nr:hypothetical protein DERF_006752 [Dermatophagoides farinae]
MYEYIFPIREEHLRKLHSDHNMIIQSSNKDNFDFSKNNVQQQSIDSSSDTNISRITYEDIEIDLNFSNHEKLETSKPMLSSFEPSLVTVTDDEQFHISPGTPTTDSSYSFASTANGDCGDLINRDFSQIYHHSSSTTSNIWSQTSINNLTDSSSFQYFDTSYLRGVMKPVVRRPAPPPPPPPPEESYEMIMMNDDLSTIHSELSSSDIFTTFNGSSTCTITPYSIDKKLPRSNTINSSTINPLNAHIKPQRSNNIRLSNNHPSMISVTDCLPPPNYATYCIRNKNSEQFRIFNDEKKITDDQKSIIIDERRKNVNIYEADNVEQDNDSHYTDKLMQMNDSTFLGIEEINHNNKNDFSKKLKSHKPSTEFRLISRMVFIFIVMMAILLALFVIIRLVVHDHHDNDYHFDYNLHWPNDGLINFTNSPIF